LTIKVNLRNIVNNLISLTVIILELNRRFNGCVPIASVVDRGSSPGQVKPKNMKLVFVASPLGTQR